MRRLIWSALSVAALSAGAVGARPAAEARPSTLMTVIVVPRGDDGSPSDIAALSDAGDPASLGRRAPDIASLGAGPSDLGLAAAGLTNGPLTPARGVNGGAVVAPKAKARLPEPATWLMLIGGMYGIGAALRRRHRASEAAFTAKVRAIAKGDEGPDRE